MTSSFVSISHPCFFYHLLLQFTTTVTTSQTFIHPSLYLFCFLFFVYISLVVSRFLSVIFSLNLSLLLPLAATLTMLGRGWLPCLHSCPHLTYGSHLGLCLCPHITLPHLFLNFSVFQNFCHLFLFKFSLAPWPLFCLPLCLHHSIPIYLLSGCLPALIFLFVLLHSLVSVPFLYSHLSVPICLHLSLLLPNIYILCLCLCLSFTHTHPCWFPCPSFPIWLSHFSIAPSLSPLPSCWVACLMCLPHASISLSLCVFCLLSCPRLPDPLSLSLSLTE